MGGGRREGGRVKRKEGGREIETSFFYKDSIHIGLRAYLILVK